MPIPAQPPAHIRLDPSVAAQAEHVAAMPPHEGDAFCDEKVAAAIRAWRVGDATEWQRVKFRARFIRAMRGRGAGRAPS